MLIVLLAQLLGSYLDLCVDIFNSKSGLASSLGVLNLTLAFKISCFYIYTISYVFLIQDNVKRKYH